MEHFSFQKKTEGVELLKTPFGCVWSGVYLVRDSGGKNYLIDSGATAEVVDSVIVPALAERGLRVRDIDFLLCTHTHGDHVGGHARLRKLGAEKIGVYEKGLDKMRDPLKYSRLIRAAFPEFSPAPPPRLDGIEPDFVLSDGEGIGPLRLIATPGHDTDCVSFLHLPSGFLLTGDSLQGNGTIAQGCALYMDLAGYRDSVKKLQELPVNGIVPGHAFYPWLENTPSCAEGSKAFLKECLELTEKYDIFLKNQQKNGIVKPEELAVRLIRSVNGKVPEKLFLALYTVTQHMKYFQK